MPIHVLLLVALAFQVPPPPVLYLEKSQDSAVGGIATGNFSQGGKYQSGIKQLSWRRAERADATSAWQVSENTYSARYQMVGVDAREGGRILYVAGIESDGTSVIEKWTFPLRAGRWDHAYSGTANPIGTPTGPYAGVTSIHGGTFRPLPPTWYAPQIEVVLDTHRHGYIDALVADPEGRYLLFGVHGSRQLFQVDLLTAGMPVTLIAAPADVPELAHVSTLSIHDHAVLGRVCTVQPANLLVATSDPQAPPNVVYFIDGDNDGVFESHRVVGFATHSRSCALATITSTGTVVHPAVPWTAPWAGDLF